MERFRRPKTAWFVLLDGGIVVLTILAVSRPADAAIRRRVPLPPRWAVHALLAGTAVIHVSEAAYAGRTARRHGLPAGPWARQTFAVGFPSLIELGRVRREVAATSA